MRVIYDLTGLEGLAEVMEPLQKVYKFDISDAGTLAKQNVQALRGQVVVLSDDRFTDQTDEEILHYVHELGQTGIQMLYIGFARNANVFESKLREMGVNAYLPQDLTEEGVQTWLHEALQTWPSDAVENDQESLVDRPSEPATENSEESRSAAQDVLDVDASTQGPEESTEAKPNPKHPTNNTWILISGSPGAGSTFIGINAAVLLASGEHVQYVEAGLRPCLTTWLGAEEHEDKATLQVPMKPAVTRDKLSVYTRNPLGSEAVNLREIVDDLAKRSNTTVLDLALQDYLASRNHQFANRTIRVLVTTSDVHRCRYLAGLPADIVVINQTSSKLPIDEEEFKSFWPGKQLIFVPYEGDQTLAIVQGHPVITLSQAIREAIEALVDRLQNGGDTDAHHLAG